MPFNILDLIEKDETLATCQIFNAEVCFGSGLRYDTCIASPQVKAEVDDFCLDNDLASYFLGVCQDFKHFGIAVSVIILNEDGTKIVRLLRKEACYCRFAPADASGKIPKILYANWRCVSHSQKKDIEVIDLLDPAAPWADLQARLEKRSKTRKFAIVSRIPTVDSTYYPIPYYAALFKGKWYNIKQLIGIAKEAKLRNHAPIKYQIEISAKYWESIFRAEGITDRRKQQERIVKEKQSILDFLTGAENSGKAWFSTFYITPDGKEQHDVVINKIDDSKEGGDWETDIQEAINMICFTMRVHSNLVGSVPGKAQNLVAASKMRVDRLVGSTLFPTMEIVEQSPANATTKWERYLELRPQLIDLEASLAEEWFSPELMSALRAENLHSDLTQPRKVVVAQIKAQIVGYLRAGSFNSRRLADIVNFIRQSENDFKE